MSCYQSIGAGFGLMEVSHDRISQARRHYASHNPRRTRGDAVGWCDDQTARSIRFVTSRGDVVVVTINHQFGAHGLTDFSRIPGDEFAGSANLDIKDIIAALE